MISVCCPTDAVMDSLPVGSRCDRVGILWFVFVSLVCRSPPPHTQTQTKPPILPGFEPGIF